MTLSTKARFDFAGRLSRAVEGDVMHDDFSRGRYASDASRYETFPVAAVAPKTQDDIGAAMRVAWEAGVPVIARGGGTGRLGQAVGEGLVLDCSKYLTRLLYYDASARTCIVEPGLCPAALNEALKPERVWFPVDIGSAAQATLGGMFATDAIGSRALLYGRMRDNIVACDAILADGVDFSFHEIPQNIGSDNASSNEASLMLDLLEEVQNNEEVIRLVQTVTGGHQGYNLQALLPEKSPQNLAAFLAGSEGTIAIAKRIELKLARRPANRALGVCHFACLGDALDAVAPIASLLPTDIELTSRRILELGFGADPNGDLARRVLRKDTQVVLLVEFMEGNRAKNAKKLKDLADLMAQLRHPRSVGELLGLSAQATAHRAHRAGIAGIYATSPKGLRWGAIREFAFPLSELSSKAQAIEAIVARLGFEAFWHGQVGAGAIYLRPWVKSAGISGNGLDGADQELWDALEELAGVHQPVEGHGSWRSYAGEATRDQRLTRLFERIKMRFDPQNRLNPGKIVGAPEPFADMLRAQPERRPEIALSALGCDGTALCRRIDNMAMCPSFKVTRDERDSPRGRANSLRLALSGQLGSDALASDAMADTMANCVSCKACKSACPRGVDVAQARIFTQAQRARSRGLTKFEQCVAFLPHSAPRLRAWRHVLNFRDILPWTANLSERFTGVSADRPWPRWSARPFSSHAYGEPGRPEVALLPDTFNQYFDPVTLRAAADVLAASGFHVTIVSAPEGRPSLCCGRTFLEAGLLDEARVEARRLIGALAPYIERGIPVVGLEPACMFTIRDEFINILSIEGASELAKASFLFEELMSRPEPARIIAPKLLNIEAQALVAAHCHQQAFGTASLAQQVTMLVPGISPVQAGNSCCGMGTSFGYKPENVAMSFRMGEAYLFPQIRSASRDTLIVADGFACRRQINDGTGRIARHTAVLLKLSLAAREKFGRNDVEALSDKRLPRRLSRLRRHYFR